VARVLVTGGAGYVGAQACKTLARAGHEPVAFDNLSTGWRAAVRYGPLIEGDLLAADALDAAFAAHPPEAVMHFAGAVDVAESVRDPMHYWRTNLVGTLNLIEAMRRHGVGRIVFSSTCAVYGPAAGETLDERDGRAPITPYGRSKLAVEHLIEDMAAAHGLRHVIFRYFNAAGADPDAEIGEDHRPETHLIPLALDAATGRRDRITIFGTDYDTPDGSCIRDYVHVSDLAEAHRLGLDRLIGGGGSLWLNLGSGTGHSVHAVIDAVGRVTGQSVPVTRGARRPGDPPRLVSGSALARERLGWTPERSDLETIIADAWAWHRKGGYSG